MKHLVLIRGLPGSGKSTLAETLVHCGLIDCHFEADDYFINDGIYVFIPEEIVRAHTECYESTVVALECDKSVVVSNTFSRLWELTPYTDYCKANNILFTVITCEGNYGNIHNCPEESIERMKTRWEHYV